MITKPLDNPRVEAMLAGLRGRLGNEIVPKADAVRASLRALARGIGVAVMIDQDARGSGIFVPFFGRPSSTIPTVGTMHLRTGAAVVATFSYPEDDGGWRIEYERLTFPGLTGTGNGCAPHHVRDDRAARSARSRSAGALAVDAPALEDSPPADAAQSRA